MEPISGESALSDVQSTREGLILELVHKYHPGLKVITGVEVNPDDTDYYGEWEEGRLTFTTECDSLDDEELTYVALHEIAHALTESGWHRDAFYGVLTALVLSEGIAWTTVISIEQVTPRLWEGYRLLTESHN